MAQTVKPVGQVAAPLVIFAFVSLFLGVAVEMLGVFGGVTEGLRAFWEKSGMEMKSDLGLPGPVGIIVTAIFCFGLIGAILGTPGGQKRFCLGFSGLILSLMLVPALGVWGIFWKPFGMLLSVVWAWFSAVVYAGMHLMPCDRLVGSTRKPTTLDEWIQERAKQKTSDVED